MMLPLLPAFVSTPEPNRVYHCDAMLFLKALQAESVHLTFTSPPYYNAKDYAQYASYEAYIQFLAQVFHEVHRVTAEGRFCVVNTSPVITERTKRSTQSQRHAIPFDLHYEMQGMGWEFVDDILWVKPEASVKNRNAGFAVNRKPLAYKPNVVTEYVMVYRKKTDKLIDWNMRQYDADTVQRSLVNGHCPTSNVWGMPPVRKEGHPAPFPAKLAHLIVQLYSYVGDTVLDPFMGSGTTAEAAQFWGRNWTGCDYVLRYAETAALSLATKPIPQLLEVG